MLQSPVYIQDDQTFQKEMNKLLCLAPSFVAVDTEFVRKTTYWPKIELIQIAYNNNKILVIDYHCIHDYSLFLQLLENQNIVKVFHSSRQDLEGFWTEFGILPTPIFDVQIAASFLGCGTSAGLADLIQTFLNDFMDKGEQHSQWDARPLRESQIHYAALDVFYLEKLYTVIISNLEFVGRKDWLNEFLMELSQPMRLIPNPELAWVKLKNQITTDRALFFLYHFAALREQIAQEMNLNRGRVILDKDLVSLCNSLAENIHIDLNNPIYSLSNLNKIQFNQFLILQQKTIEKCKEIKNFSNFKKFLDDKINLSFSNQQKENYFKIKQIIRNKANSLNLPANYLGPPAMIESYVQTPNPSHPLVSGWRFVLLKELLEESDE